MVQIEELNEEEIRLGWRQMGVAFSTEKYPDELERLVRRARRNERVSGEDINDALKEYGWCAEAVELFFRGVKEHRKRLERKKPAQPINTT